LDVLLWAKGAETGQRVVYAHRTPYEIEYQLKMRLLHSAMQAHEAGLVFLAQRRKGDGFDYEATRISRPVAKKLGLLEWEPRVRSDAVVG
jgi:hypothetical protein